MKTKIKTWFEKNYPNIIEDLQNTQHEHSSGSKNPFHLEGDCWTHTQMVFERIEWNNPNLYFAALLHDLGKIETRKELRGDRVSFRGHESLSMVKSIDILNEAKLSFDINIIEILQMIAWHGELWVKQDVEKTKYLQQINNKFGFDLEWFNNFVHFVKADALGRTMEDQDKVKFVSEQMDFLENYIPFNGSKYFKHNPTKEVIFMIGLSGSGKSTWLETKQGYKVISVDNYLSKGKLDYNSVDYDKNKKKAHDNSIKDIKKCVEAEENTIIDMTNLTKETRRVKLALFPTTKYKRIAILFLVGEKQISKNLKNRPEKTIPNTVLKQQKTEFELPGYDEFSEITYIL